MRALEAWFIMNKPLFESAQQAQDAFYSAFEHYDLTLMKQVWADHDETVCIHPMGEMLHGKKAIELGWTQIFDSDQALKFKVKATVTHCDSELCIFTVTEYIFVDQENEPRPAIIATNAYQNSAQGWKMILHHASPAVLPVRNSGAGGSDRLH